MRGSSICGSGLHLDRSDNTSYAETRNILPSNAVVPTEKAEASRAMVGGKSVAENYEFAGMHHIFDDCVGHSATAVKFANDEKNTFAYSSMSGAVCVCQTHPHPRTLHVLNAHQGGVSDFAWSLSNDLMLTVGFDSCLRLWQTKDGRCLRAIKSTLLGMVESPLRCCLFQPLNNNMALCGNNHGQLVVVNISTGKAVGKGGNGKVSGSILCMTFDSSGKLLWVGTDKGAVASFLFDLATGRLRKAHHMSLAKPDSMVTSVQARSWISREARDPSLLVNLSKNALCLYRVVDDKGMLQLRKSFPVRHTRHLIKSLFCPLMSFRKGACIVSGSEDADIAFFDIERARVNSLRGHSSVVVDVSFNSCESMLVSCDVEGVVIAWKRELNN